MSAIDDKAKRAAVAGVLDDWRVRTFCTRDTERCGRIADTTWACCGDILQAEHVSVGDRELLGGACRIRVEQRPDYADTVSFIPAWLLGLFLKLIISLLIDFWINYEKGP